MNDVVIVGSGASAVSAAVPLVRAGLRVTMLDAGRRDEVYEPLVPPQPWSKTRRTDPGQHRYFLGDGLEGVPRRAGRVGAQLTPPRAFVTADAARLLPRRDAGFVGLEGPAQGGLASAWGASILPWVEGDFAGLPITAADLAPHYDAVCEMMGVCGRAGDDLSARFGDPSSMMPPLELDTGAGVVLGAYERRRSDLTRRGLVLGHARLAVCSREYRGRGPHSYLDMDFWCDHGKAVYRPRWTLDELLAHSNFRYEPGVLVHSYAPGSPVRVLARRLAGGGEVGFEGRALVLAAGALGSARIVLRSLGAFDTPVPLVSNHSPYFVLVNLGLIGRPVADRRHSLTQLTGFYVPPRGGQGVKLQVYSYRSLLTFKMMKEAPMALRPARGFLRALIPVLTILGVHHPDGPGPGKRIMLRRGQAGAPAAPDDVLEAAYSRDAAEQSSQARTEGEVLGLFRSMGCLCVRRLDLGAGASIHYAGTLAMSASPGPLQTDALGRVGGATGVHVVDGSVFPRLPGQGVTLTAMANAHRVGALLAATLGGR